MEVEDYFKIILKYTIFISYIFTVICGFIFLVIGIMDKVNLYSYGKVFPSDYQVTAVTPNFTIAIGVLAIFIGCFVAVLQKSYISITSVWTITIIACICIVLLMQLIVSIVLLLTMSNKTLMKNTTVDFMKSVFDKYNSDKTNRSRVVVDFVQREIECCGVESPDYWIALKQAIPESCLDPSTKALHKNGCAEELTETLRRSARRLGIIFLILSLVEAINLVAVIFWVRKLNEPITFT